MAAGTRSRTSEHSTRPVWGEVDLSTVSHNVGLIRQWLRPSVELTVSVKANAYGHGVTQIVAALEAVNVTQVMTASLSDARAIRATGSRVRIVMLAACLPHAIGQYARADVIPTVYSLASAQALSRDARRLTEVYVKVDAGLGRVGVAVEDAAALVRRIARLPNLVVGGVYTHLPFADHRGETWARRRLSPFINAVGEIRRAGVHVPYVQAVSSSGVLAGIDDEALTAVCVGSLIYGLPGLNTTPCTRSGLRPTLASVRARLIDVTHHERARPAGSGGNRRYRAGSITGVIPIGIQDGYPTLQPGAQLQVLVNGQRSNVVGVSLAHTVLELSRIPEVRVGDEVVVVGSQREDSIGVSELAIAAGTTILETLMRFDQHLTYDYISGGASVPTKHDSRPTHPMY